jgi:hypothetical protein
MPKKIKQSRQDDPLFSYMTVQKLHKSSERVLLQENAAANLVGGKRHAGSGSIKTYKSDASSEFWRIECKQTEKDSMGLKVQWLEKITREALSTNKKPMMHLRFQNTAVDVAKDWILMPEWVFKALCEENCG